MEDTCNRRLKKTAKRRALWFVLLTRYCLGDKIKEECDGKLEEKRPLSEPRYRW